MLGPLALVAHRRGEDDLRVGDSAAPDEVMAVELLPQQVADLRITVEAALKDLDKEIAFTNNLTHERVLSSRRDRLGEILRQLGRAV
jgi:hypothetical protein